MRIFSIICLFVFMFSGVTHSSFLVYYFHGDARCSSCIKLEKYTEEAVKGHFQTEIESGKITFQVVNVELCFADV